MVENKIIELIEQYDVITIFRHVLADHDALGSQFGLAHFIKHHYPNKQVYILGETVGTILSQYGNISTVNEAEIKDSLAIILDTPVMKRIDDERWKLAKYRIKIDHHPFVEKFAELEIIEEDASATCDILTRLFATLKLTLSKDSATCLYRGLISDTLRFSIPAVTQKTLLGASYLLNFDIDVAQINQDVFSVNQKNFKYENFIRSNYQYEQQVAYGVMKIEDYEQFHITYEDAKDKVYALGNVEEFEIWALFTEDNNNRGTYSGSIRSKHVIINQIASEFGGGGHPLASGIKGLHEEDIQCLLKKLIKALSN